MRRSSEPTRSTRWRPSRASTRSGAASPRTGRWPPAGAWGSASSPTARWAAGFSTDAPAGGEGTDRFDYRARHPRFAPGAREANLPLAEALAALARAKGATAAQLALAWVMSRGDDVVPIPGTKRRRWLRENAAAADVGLSEDDVAAIEAAVPRGAVVGERYPESSMSTLNG